MLAGLTQRGAEVALCTSSFRESCYAVLEGTGLAPLLPFDRRVTLDVRRSLQSPIRCPIEPTG